MMGGPSDMMGGPPGMMQEGQQRVKPQVSLDEKGEGSGSGMERRKATMTEATAVQRTQYH